MSVEQLNDFNGMEQKESSVESQEKNSYVRFLTREIFENIRKIEKEEKNKSKHSFNLDDLHEFMKIWPLGYFNNKYRKDLTKQEAQSIVKQQITDCVESIYKDKEDSPEKNKLLVVLQNTADLAASHLIEKKTFDPDESTRYISRDIRNGEIKKADFSAN